MAQLDGTVLFTTGESTSVKTFTYTVNDNKGLTSNIATVEVSVVDDVGLSVFHRSGQTFITWDESGPSDGYHIYRASAPITQANLSDATQLTQRWGPLDHNTSVNVQGGSNVPANFVIENLSDALANDQGLFVYTTQHGEAGTVYYAVTSVADGVENLTTLQASGAINESVNSSRDVLTVSVNGGKGRIYTQYMDYSSWNPTFNGYAYNYSVAFPANYNSAQSYPLLIRVWDWMDHHDQLVERRGDEFAYLMTSHGKADRTIDWQTQGAPTVQAFTDANAGFSAIYNQSGHTWAAFDSVVKSMFGLVMTKSLHGSTR